jgi:tRNA(Ile)-lysidine synthase
VLSKLNRALFRAGDRVGIAVSGGADSVALLRAMIDVRSELGLVLSTVHFNHKLRSEESDHDEEFVGTLAHQFDLPFYPSESDTRLYSQEKELSIEAAARELRYAFFGKLIKDGNLDKVATAHTLDDQAETVLLRIFRGTGTSGLAGILPRLKTAEGEIVRPLLSVHRAEILEYLNSLKQPWREDSTNSDATFTRNRIRHELMPLLEKNYNPEIKETLASLAEIAHAEGKYWAAETADAFVRCYRNGQVSVSELVKLPLALQRRIVRLAAVQRGATIDFAHTERVTALLKVQPSREVRTLELPSGFRAILCDGQLSFATDQPQAKPCGFNLQLAIPGEVQLPELRIVVRASLITGQEELASYNDDRRLDPHRLPPSLVIRNWRPGDRFWPVHTRSEKKVKDLLQGRHVPSREKAFWPVALAGDEIVWMRGFPVSARHAARPGVEQREAVVIEELPLSPKLS